ncbi:MAG: hypothetical protein V4563_14200 [Pseudomonadota bacterium]
MPINFNVAPPEWLTRIAQPIDASKDGALLGTILGGATNAAINSNKPEGGSFFNELPGGIAEARMNQQDPNWRIKNEAFRSQILSQQVSRMATLATMQTKNAETAAFARDLPSINAAATVLAKDPTADVAFVPESAQGTRILMEMRRNASSSAVGKAMTEGRTHYDQRFAKVAAADPEVASGLDLPPGSFPSQMNWQALSVAEQRVKIRADNAAKQAEIDALARGDVPSVTIGPKGVSTTYKASPAEKPSIMPVEITTPSGLNLVVNPKTGHFVEKKGANEKVMTVPQLQGIVKDLETTGGPENTNNAAIIRNYLSSAATNQIAGPKIPKPSPSRTQTNSEPVMNMEDFKRWQEQQAQP